MDLSLILSIVAIVLSIITLWLTEFRGPNISLLNIPKFEVNDETLSEQQIREYTPRWFHLKPVPFVFANYGGKAGTILDLKLNFFPHNSFKAFFDIFYASIVTYEGDLSPPITIEESDNQYLKVSPEIRSIEWKKITLAEILDPNLKVDDMVAKALEKSKEKFKGFCDFLENSQELGKVSCTITLTKGRFRTKVTEKKLFENISIANHYVKALSSLRGCLGRWENLKPTKVELLNEVKRDFEGLTRELKENLIILGRTLHEHSISETSKLRVDIWNRLQLQRIWTPYETKIRWFLIKREEGLKEDLTKLYETIVKYNSSIDELMSLGELRTQKHFQSVNAEREKLHSDVEKMWDRLSYLSRRYIS